MSQYLRLASGIFAVILFGVTLSCEARPQPSDPSQPDKESRKHESHKDGKSAKSAAPATSRALITSAVPKFFFVDPVNGNKTGDGSALKPWKTLAEVISAKVISGSDLSRGTVHSGDVIYLLSGNHGVVKMTGNNTDYITIQAAPGHTPILNGLTMTGSSNSKWVFKGLTFQNAPGAKAINLVRLDVSNLVVAGNTVCSQPDVGDWTPADWLTYGSTGISCTGKNVTVTDNIVRNVRRGITVSGDSVLVANNLVDYYADDGIDFTSGNTTIRNNVVTNHYGHIQDTNHNDAMQGWALDGIQRTNLVIDSNLVVESTGVYPAIPPLPSFVGQDYTQGITIFDGDWTHVTVTNNIVACSSYHGLSFYGFTDSVIENNTVVRLSGSASGGPWLGVFPSKAGARPINVTVRNNISNGYSLAPETIHDHNIAIKPIAAWSSIPTSITGVNTSSLFVRFDPANRFLDFNLVDRSPAIGAGTAIGAPATDFRGRRRKATAMDIGAYAK